jgi:flagellar basal-body rod modification protein FlgD
MSVTPVSSSSFVGSGDSAAQTGRVPKQVLGQEDFLKLITVQLAKQDPLKPMEDTSFMAQMAQFSALEQNSQMARDMSVLRSDVSLQSASALIGREVTLRTTDGPVTGTVASVDSSAGEVRLQVGETLYPVSSVLRVAPVAAPAPQS